MKIFSLSSPRLFRKTGAVAASASVVLFGLALQPAQAQNFVPAPNGDNTTKWVAVDDQIVPAASVIHGRTSDNQAPLSFFPNVRKWPKGRVPYTFADNMSPAKRALFESGCREWEKYADLHFFPRTDETAYIVVTSTANESNSLIGMAGYPQTLNLADWANKITVVHELGHALGVIHEQSRPDRDPYVTIHPENVQDGLIGNFDKVEGALNTGTYDFDSMMHYYGTAFSKNGKLTIETTDAYKQFQNKMGQSDHVSEGDKTGMALIYGKPGLNGRGIIKPEYPKTKDVITAKPIGNGQPADYTYKWFKNNVEIVGEIANTLNLGGAGNGDKGDIITVLISGPDENGAASTQDAGVKVINSAPKVTPEDLNDSNKDTRLVIVNEAGNNILSRQLTGTDDDNDALSFVIVTNVEKGVFTLQKSGAFTYQPNAGFEGNDSFKVAASDGETAGLPETFIVKVKQKNDKPVFKDMALGATLGFAFNAPLGATDVNGDTLTYELVSGELPDGLELSSDGNITGTPTTLQKTEAVIRADDGHEDTADAKVSIEVKEEDTSPSIQLTVTPKEPRTNDIITVKTDITSPIVGDVRTTYRFKVNGNLVQTSASNKFDLSAPGHGDKGDVITCNVTAANGVAGDNEKSTTKSINVAVRNSAPVAFGSTVEALPNVTGVFELNARDADGDPLIFKLVGGSDNGNAALRTDTNGKLKLFYRSRPGFEGKDIVRFTVSDGRFTSNVARVLINVKVKAPVVNRAPVASDDSLRAYVGETVTRRLVGSDPDRDDISFVIVENVLYGTAEIKLDSKKMPILTYVSPDKFHESDRVVFVAVDSKGAKSKPATATITFINRAPVAKSDSLKATSGEPTSQVLVAEDADNDEVSFKVVNAPRNGTGEIKRDAQGVWRVYFTANANYVGEDRIRFVAIDAQGNESAPALISITVASRSATSAAGSISQSAVAPSASGS